MTCTAAAQALQTQVQYTPQGHTARESNTQGEKTYHYNGAERLIGYASQPEGHSTPNIEAHYRYDPLGRRIAKQVKEGQTTQVTYYFYSDTGLLGETDAQGQMTKAYGFDPHKAQQGLWSTDPLWQAQVHEAKLTHPDTGMHYLHTDHLGTPMLGTSQQGAITWKAVAQAFGAPQTLAQSQVEMNLRFPGQYWDKESGENYNFHRYYQADISRYKQSDPLGLYADVNLFSYSYENPMTYFDATGETPFIGLPALYCLRFPKICREILRCISSPEACRKKLCKFGNLIYDSCHQIYPCRPCGESCVQSQGKMVFLSGCYALRVAMSRCYAGDMLPNSGHAQQLAIIRQHMATCMEAISVNCTGCCGN